MSPLLGIVHTECGGVLVIFNSTYFYTLYFSSSLFSLNHTLMHYIAFMNMFRVIWQFACMENLAHEAPGFFSHHITRPPAINHKGPPRVKIHFRCPPQQSLNAPQCPILQVSPLWPIVDSVNLHTGSYFKPQGSSNENNKNTNYLQHMFSMFQTVAVVDSKMATFPHRVVHV